MYVPQDYADSVWTNLVRTLDGNSYTPPSPPDEVSAYVDAIWGYSLKRIDPVASKGFLNFGFFDVKD